MTLSAAVLAAGLAGSALAPAQATAPIAPATTSSSAVAAADATAFAPTVTAADANDANSNWKRHSFTDPYVGEVSIALPPGYTLSRQVHGEPRNFVDVKNGRGVVVATFRSAPPRVAVTPFAGSDLTGDLDVLRTQRINVPSVKTDSRDIAPVAQFLALSDSKGTNGAIGITNQSFKSTKDTFLAYLTVASKPQLRPDGGRGEASTFAFGDFPALTLEPKPGTTQRDFKNVADAKAYMNSQDFKTRWSIVNSLRIKQVGLG